MTEDDYLGRVLDTAKLHGWHAHHCRPARMQSGRWATPIQGDKGFPDLVLARDGIVILPEVKLDTGRLSPAQRQWRDAIGAQWRCWKPADWPEVQETLR